MVRPPGLEPGTHGLKVRCSTTELRAHMVVFRTSEYFHAWLLYTPPITLLSTPILLCYWETSWGLSLTSLPQFTTWSRWRESNPHFQIGSLKFYHSLNYTCIREVVLASFPSHGARYRIRTDTVFLPSDFKSLAYTCSANRANGDATGIRIRVASVKGMWTNHYSIAPKERYIYLRILGHISDPAPRW